MTLNPTSGSPGTSVNVTGDGFTPSAQVQLAWDVNGLLTKNTTADGNGHVTVSFTVPNDTPGIHPVFLTDGRNQASQPFNLTTSPPPSPPPGKPTCPTPSVKFPQISGAAGDKFVATGAGWIPGGTVTAGLESAPPRGTFSGSAKVAQDGTWAIGIQVGTDAPLGRYVFFFSQNGSGCSLRVTQGFTVVGGDKPPSSPDLVPTAIKFDGAAAALGTKIHFDSGIKNIGGQDTGVFNIKWFVDGKEVGAYGSHEGIPAGATVLDGNSQFDWTFNTPGKHTITFTVDVDNHVAESNEKNNSYSVTVADERYKYTNGCTMSPDAPLGAEFKEVCNNHDVCYARFNDGHHIYGTNEDGRKKCDLFFLYDMSVVCKDKPAGVRRNACYVSASTYYNAVRLLGGKFYYDNNTLY
jgi:hypothetical protein